MIIYDNKIYQHIPKTAGTSLRRLFSFYDDKFIYGRTHSPISSLEKHPFNQYEHLETVACIRKPVSWYNSWVNYTKNKFETDPLTSIIWKYSKTEEDFILNSMNLSSFFEKGNRIKELKRQLIRNSKTHIINFIDNLQELSPTFFKNQSLYGFYIFRQLKHDSKLFRFETELDNLIEYFGFNSKTPGQKLPTTNMTKYAYNLLNDDKLIDIVNENDNLINNIWEEKKFENPYSDSL
jgi:hypothetical protein